MVIEVMTDGAAVAAAAAAGVALEEVGKVLTGAAAGGDTAGAARVINDAGHRRAN